MPDPEGNITAGTDTVEAPGNTPVLSQPMPPDIITGTLPSSVPPAAPAVGGPVAPNLPQPLRPTQQPSFFRRVLLSLGQGLIEGTKAGLQAPLTPQGPAIAAQTAINAPEMARQRLTAAQLDKLRIEQSTINLAMSRYALTHVDDERAQAYYKAGQKYANDLIEKGNANLVATGTADDIHKMMAQEKGKNPDRNYMAFPNPGGAGHDQEDGYMLLEVAPKERLSADVPERKIPAYSATTPQGFTINYPERTIPAGKKGQTIAEYNAMATPIIKMSALQDADIGRTTGIISREAVAKAGRDLRLKETIMNNNTRYAIARLREEQAKGDKADKDVLTAVGKFNQADKNLKDSQGKIGNKVWSTLTKKETEEVTTAREAYDSAKQELQNAVAKRDTGPTGKPKIAVTNAPPTPTRMATGAELKSALDKAGGDAKKARIDLAGQGLGIPQ